MCARRSTFRLAPLAFLLAAPALAAAPALQSIGAEGSVTLRAGAEGTRVQTPAGRAVRIRATPSAEGLSIAIVLVEPRISLNRRHLGMPRPAGKAIIYLRLMPATAAPPGPPLITAHPGCSCPLAHARAPGVGARLMRTLVQKHRALYVAHLEDALAAMYEERAAVCLTLERIYDHPAARAFLRLRSLLAGTDDDGER